MALSRTNIYTVLMDVIV